MSHRHPERHKTEHIGWLRAAVLGANDGIVSTASLILGVAAAGGEFDIDGLVGTQPAEMQRQHPTAHGDGEAGKTERDGGSVRAPTPRYDDLRHFLDGEDPFAMIR